MKRKNLIGFVIGLCICSFFLALASISVLDHNRLLMFVGGIGSWWGYLIAHKSTEGTIVDGKESEKSDGSWKMIPKKAKSLFGTGIGALIFVLALVLGIHGVSRESMAITFPALLLWLTGYVTAHYSTMGEPL